MQHQRHKEASNFIEKKAQNVAIWRIFWRCNWNTNPNHIMICQPDMHPDMHRSNFWWIGWSTNGPVITINNCSCNVHSTGSTAANANNNDRTIWMEELCTLPSEYDSILSNHFQTIAKMIVVEGYVAEKFNTSSRQIVFDNSPLLLGQQFGD